MHNYYLLKRNQFCQVITNNFSTKKQRCLSS